MCVRVCVRACVRVCASRCVCVSKCGIYMDMLVTRNNLHACVCVCVYGVCAFHTTKYVAT